MCTSNTIPCECGNGEHAIGAPCCARCYTTRLHWLSGQRAFREYLRPTLELEASLVELSKEYL